MCPWTCSKFSTSLSNGDVNSTKITALAIVGCSFHAFLLFRECIVVGWSMDSSGCLVRIPGLTVWQAI